jgi:hypothetical protein
MCHKSSNRTDGSQNWGEYRSDSGYRDRDFHEGVSVLVLNDDAPHIPFMDKVAHSIAEFVSVDLEVFEELIEFVHLGSVAPNDHNVTQPESRCSDYSGRIEQEHANGVGVGPVRSNVASAEGGRNNAAGEQSSGAVPGVATGTQFRPQRIPFALAARSARQGGGPEQRCGGERGRDLA